MSCGVAHRCGLDLALLWLLHRLAAIALIRPLAWETPYAVGVALKKKTKDKKKQKTKTKKPENKTTMRYHLTAVRTAIINKSSTNSGKSVEKRGLSYTTGGNVNWYNSVEVPQKTKYRTTI